MSRPHLSIVIVTCYGRSKKLKQCLLSILNNSFPQDRYEILIVSSGAGEESRKVVSELTKNHPQQSIRWLGVTENIGPAKARNIGIKVCSGEITVFTDDDCVVPKNWLKTLSDGYQSYPEVVGVGGISLPSGKLIKTNIWAWWEAKAYKKLLKTEDEYISTKRDEHPAYTGNISYRRHVLEEVGGFREDFAPNVYGEDGDLKERVLALGYKVLFIPTVVQHNTDYTFKRFWYTNQCRGRGIVKFKKEHGKRFTGIGEWFLKIVVTPLVFAALLVKRKLNFKFAGLETLAYLAKQVGKARTWSNK